ncbi:unnamed protein product [Clonostachys rosea f. rosea IK726]|uniref:Erythromycin biosynthesis protein CIII-like C-terminal domain-containing protein n=2 Tax=Bionectria ochroleuca TaxID=29856 RepID=A0A0B7K921_BIOOC|nr:unnamed protein product [Clonostachys rosea f. rosea IK726]
MFARIVLIGAVLIASLAYFLSSGEAAPRVPYIQGRNKTVLVLANKEHGLSNVHLSTTYALLEGFPDLEVHYATFPGVRSKVDKISKFARAQTPAARDVVYHDLKGASLAEACEMEKELRYPGMDFQDTMMGPPGAAGIANLAKDIQWWISPWNAEDHMTVYEEISDLIDEIDPAVVVLDTLFRPAIDATRDKNRLHAIVTPNLLTDNFLGDQPHGSMFWKYPALGSGFKFPVPWHKIPENIYLNIRMINALLLTPGLSAKKAVLRDRGIKEPINLLGMHRTDVPWITMNTEGASVPVDYVPPNVTSVGPILMDSAPAAEQDPELAQWLKKAPTIIFNPGSHFLVSEPRAKAVAAALAKVMAESNVQIVWKLKRQGEYSDEFLEPLQPYLAADRIKVSEWLSADIYSLLQTGDVIASVHHGGSNCYHEAIASGVAQVVLPMWIDLYNFAALAENIGVGVWGCRETSPDWTADCLSSSLLRVIADNEEGANMREKAKQLGEKVRSGEKGRDLSAREIAKLAYVK